MRMLWDNVGVAPPYRDYRLAFRLTPMGGEPQVTWIFRSETSVKGWLPGPQSVIDSLPVPDTLSAGRYELALAVVDPVSHVPAIRLAIAGRDQTGWYPVSHIMVSPDF